ncbi:GM17685 [Drosophila sechellia]|uniref:GM17685 n=1 Tax=Drosophila sechellia TaxID=7238 RepID=B4ILJ7_DROSE|nr:GM17685 [Drosophila sechellia]
MTYMTLVSFFLPCITIVKYVVAEKERQQKAVLTAMGFSNSIHWLAWYTKSIILLILCLLIMIAIFSIGLIYEFCSLVCLMTIFLVYVHSLVLFAFFVSSFFSRSISAVVATILIYLATALPFLIVGTEKSSLAAQTAASIGLNSGLFYILDSVAVMEMQSVGAQWYTIHNTASSGHKLSIVGHMLIMISISWIELLICLYIEAVRTGEFEVPQPWTYPFQRRYWCPLRNVSSVFHQGALLPLAKTNSEGNLPGTNPTGQPFIYLDDRTQENFQRVNIKKKIGIEIRSLSKTFGFRNVVKDLFINVYENEITALVGHKGSGKTTIIMMLCGILQPTTGTVLINGYDIVTEAKVAKSSLGICPQHSVIFKGMSARDHIYFFSRIKGYNKTEALMESNIYISKLGLVDSQKWDAMKLSPGNQRRLSLACALCAGSKVILCDEPSSGLDPIGRHELWRFLQKEKHGRTILMTSQQLEEGEIIADRIAIMNDGQVLCYGTLGYLKHLPNTSYTLSCQMAPNSKADNLTDLVEFYMTTTSPVFLGVDVSYKLPRSKIDRFPELFQQLEENKKSLNVVSFGVSDSSLDGIYLSLDYGQGGLRLRGGADQGVNATHYWIEIWLLMVHCLVWFIFLWLSNFGCEIGYRFKPKLSNRNWHTNGKHIRVLDEERRVGQIPKYEHEDYPIIVDQLNQMIINSGDTFGLLGAQGTGKTSIFKMIAGETCMSHGNIYVRGHSLREHRNDAKMEVGYCPQGDTAPNYLTGRQLLRIHCLLHGVPKQHIKAVSEQMAIEFNFKDQLDRPIHTYSGGKKRKLNIALAIDSGSVLCLDETNGSVDHATQRFIWRKLEAVKSSGRSVLLTTHSMEEANAVCSKVAFLVAGEMMLIGSMQQVRSEVTNTIVMRLRVNPSEGDEAFETCLIYHININVTTLSNLFYQMEKIRNDGLLEDYSITQVSLDEIYRILDDEEDPNLVGLDSTHNSEVSEDIRDTTRDTTRDTNLASDVGIQKEKDKRKKVEEDDTNTQKSTETRKPSIKRRPATQTDSTDTDEMEVEKGEKLKKKTSTFFQD